MNAGTTGEDRDGGRRRPGPVERTRRRVGTLGIVGGTLVASGSARAAEGPLQMANGKIPVVGPTSILVGAVVLAGVLHLMDRFVGDFSLGTDEPTDRTHQVRQTAGHRDTTGSTAGRKLETSASKIKEQKAEAESTETDSSVGTPNATATQTDRRTELRHSTGTFQTSSGGGTVMVTSVGFEPDLLFLTGASKGTGASDGVAQMTAFAEGWSHGIVHRKPSGDIDQYAVSIADTGAGTAGGGIREEAGLDLPVITEGEGTEAVWGKVTTTVDEGFQFEVSTPAGHEERATIQYHAIDLPDGADASVGTFGFGSEPRKGKVDLGVDADFVSLTATTGARPLTRSAERPVAISHGTVVQPDETPFQSSVGSAVSMVGGGYAAKNDRALHLLHPGDDDIAGTTSMRVTTLGPTMRLKLEEIHEEAPVAFAVYAAVSIPGRTDPTTGLVRSPGPQKGARRRVDTDFTPGAVTLGANAGAVDDRDRFVGGGLSMLGWSHGVVGGTPGGMAGKMTLRTMGEDRLAGQVPLGLGLEEDGFVLAPTEEMDGSPPMVLYTAWPGEMD